TLTATPNPATVCDVVTLTSTVTGNVTGSFDVPPPGPTGFVTFFDGNIVLGTVPLQGNTATVRAGPFTSGQHRITAIYNGDNVYGSSASPQVTLNVLAAPPAVISVTFDVGTAVFGQTVNVTASITPTNVQGNITFFDGQQTLGSAQIRNG